MLFRSEQKRLDRRKTSKRAIKKEKEELQFTNAFLPSSEVMMSAVRLTYIVLQHLERLVVIAGNAYVSAQVGGGGRRVMREEIGNRVSRII